MLYLNLKLDNLRRLSYLYSSPKQSRTVDLKGDKIIISYRENGAREFLTLTYNQAVDYLSYQIKQLKLAD